MRFLVKLLGLALLLLGIYFLGQNIIFSTSVYGFWRGIPALGAALCVISGTVSLIFFRRNTGSMGWVLLAIGIALVFISGSVFLRPTTLWQFFVAFATLAAGYKLLTQGRIDF